MLELLVIGILGGRKGKCGRMHVFESLCPNLESSFERLSQPIESPMSNYLRLRTLQKQWVLLEQSLWVYRS